MISHDVEITDLDPRLWRNLSFFWKKVNFCESRPEDPNMLTILHDQGRVLRISAPKDQAVPEIQHVDDPQELARKLFSQNPGLERVQILDRHSVQIYSAKVQKIEWNSFDYDDFLLRAFQMADEDPAGLSFYPPRTAMWRGFSIPEARNWLLRLPNPSSVVLGIFKDAAPWFTLILRMTDKKIKFITSMEYFSRFGIDIRHLPSSVADLGTICDLAAQHIAPVATALVCDFSVAEQLTLATKKNEILSRAIAAGYAATSGIPFG
jgi:hypothetical protein